MANALAAPPMQNLAATADDDLGIDRAFVLQMAQLPFIAAVFVGLSFVGHALWNSIAPQSADLAPVVIVSAAMILAAIIDGWAFRVPNWLTLSLVLSGWALGLLHDCGVAVDAGHGGFGYSLLGTAVGFGLLFPILFIGGMGQGDVKMQMGFGAWLGAFFGAGHPAFGGHDAVMILLYAFCAGTLVGGVFGLIMMVLRRAFGSNIRNFREIVVDMQVLLTQGAKKAAERANSRRSSWVRLPYGVPLCVGFLGTLAYLYWLG
jgi:prepilin peptidase CpaA